jgi:quercetin dioxygenase-like cupin family protein
MYLDICWSQKTPSLSEFGIVRRVGNKMKKYLKGRLDKYAVERKGYITGSFFPNTELEHDTSIEINYANLPESFTAPAHYHAQSKSWIIVTKGKMYFKINNQAVEVGAGEFLIFGAGVHEEVTRVDPGTSSFTIHSPSIPGGDKQLI